MQSKTLKRGVLLAALALAAAVPAASAHGPVIQIGIDGDHLVTRGLILDEPYDTLTPIQRIYEIPMVQRSVSDANDGWYGQINNTNPNAVYLGPGIAYGIGGFGSGKTITEKFADGVKRWDGTAFVDPGLEQFQGLRGSIALPSTTFTSADAGPFAGFTITAPATITPLSHSQVYWRLLGDGVSPTAASDDGVYLVTLQLTSSQVGGGSDPFYILFEKNASRAEADAAVAFLNTNVVPEPGALAVSGMAVAGLLARWGRRRG